jgi:hypothetical protein
LSRTTTTPSLRASPDCAVCNLLVSTPCAAGLAPPLRRRSRTIAALPSGQPYPFSLLAECYGAALAASSFGHLLLVSFQVFSFVHLVLVRYLKF